MIESLKIQLEDQPWNVLVKPIFVEKSIPFSTTRHCHPDVHLQKTAPKQQISLEKTC